MTTTDTTITVDEFREQARAWIAANLEPRPPHSEREARRDRTADDIAAARAVQRKLFDGGFAGISYPSEYGGRGLTAVHERAFREEAADHVTPDLGVAGGVTFGPIARSLLAHASPEFLQRHIPKILSGEEIWCQFYSEPEAGSDLAGIRTRATRDGDHWILAGSKIWSSGAYYADWAMCLARTDWDVPKHRGLTWFAVPTDADGLTINQITQINGNAEFCEEFLDDVIVTDDDIIGEVNRGWSVTQTMLVYERGAGESNTAVLRTPRRSRPISSPSPGASVAALTRSPARRSPAPTSTTTPSTTSGAGSRPGCARRTRPTPPSPPTASWRPACTRRSGRASRWRSVGPRRSPGRAVTTPGRRRPSTTSTGARSRSPRAPTRCSATASASASSACPREPSFDTTKPFSEVLRQSRSWSGKVG